MTISPELRNDYYRAFDASVPAMWRTYANRGEIINAIKEVRRWLGVGLVEAKNVVSLHNKMHYWVDHGCVGESPLAEATEATPASWVLCQHEASGDHMRVVELGDGTYNVEYVEIIHCKTLGELLKVVRRTV